MPPVYTYSATAIFNQNYQKHLHLLITNKSPELVFTYIYMHYYLITKKLLCTTIALKEDLTHHQNICQATCTKESKRYEPT